MGDMEELCGVSVDMVGRPDSRMKVCARTAPARPRAAAGLRTTEAFFSCCLQDMHRFYKLMRAA